MRTLKRALEAGFLIAVASGCSPLLGLDQYVVQSAESECSPNPGCQAETPDQGVGPEAIGKVFEPTVSVNETPDSGATEIEPQPAPRNTADPTPDGGVSNGTANTDGGGTAVGFVSPGCSADGAHACAGQAQGGKIAGCVSSADCDGASTRPACDAASGSCVGCATDEDCAGNAAGTSCVSSGPLKGACAACDPGDNSGCAWPNGRCDPETPRCGPPPSCAGLDSLCGTSSGYGGYGGASGTVMTGMGAGGPTGPGPYTAPVGQDCCSSPQVTGGTFYRSNDANYAASVSSFRLDRFEVVVGRFQRFVNAWIAGFRPSSGDGKHAHANAGKGLTETSGDYEQGWDVKWADNLATTAADWDANLSCEASYRTWPTSTMRPQTCVTWYEAYAFCIWDGGFLPSEAEWNYAAAGGAAQRPYAWGDTVPSADAALAAYGCYYNADGTCSSVTNIAPVGSIPAGDGMYGQSDLAGNVWEWNLDWYSPSYSSASCDDCADSSPSQHRVRRGSSFRYSAESLVSSFRGRDTPMSRRFDGGFRCARAP